jgi:GalNAc-alpha-(1->4)-GalNAc-alpha-(1->3)-diNAcBac-PP-undecaprenol alpha-1,4-N-acetyl-D-galactosaminyltransferase
LEKVTLILPKLTAGGTERTAVELANFLSDKGYSVSILLMYNLPIFFSVNENIKIYSPEVTLKSGFNKFFNTLKILWFLRKKLKEIKPDVTFCIGYILYALFASINLKTRVVISGRSSPLRVRFPNSKVLTNLYKFLHFTLKRRVNGIIAQTEMAKVEYQKKYGCEIVVIPNFLRKINHYPENKKGKIIVNVGRLSYEKGQDFLIHAFSKLKNNDWELWIVGGGPLQNKLQKLISQLDLNDRVTLFGEQKNVDYYLSQASIFAFSSKIEGYPNALIEGMAHSLAPVSIDCVAGPSEIIMNGKNGFLVKEGDLDAFSQSLDLLISDSVLLKNMQMEASKVNEINDLELICGRYERFLFTNKII